MNNLISDCPKNTVAPFHCMHQEKFITTWGDESTFKKTCCWCNRIVQYTYAYVRVQGHGPFGTEERKWSLIDEEIINEGEQ